MKKTWISSYWNCRLSRRRFLGHELTWMTCLKWNASSFSGLYFLPGSPADLFLILCLSMLQSLSRFSKEDMVRLSVALGIPKYYIRPQGTKATGMEALMLMLRRFAYPSRLCDLVPLFGRAEQELSHLFNTVRTDNLCMVSMPSPLHAMQPHLSLDRKRHTYSFLPPLREFRLGMDGSRNLFSSYPCQRFSLDPMLWVH